MQYRSTNANFDAEVSSNLAPQSLFRRFQYIWIRSESNQRDLNMPYLAIYFDDRMLILSDRLAHSVVSAWGGTPMEAAIDKIKQSQTKPTQPHQQLVNIDRQISIWMRQI